MDVYYRSKIDEIFKKDLQTHENIKEKPKSKKDSQLELLSQLKRTDEEKNKKKLKLNLNTRGSVNVFMNKNNRILLNKVAHSNVNNDLSKQETNDFIKMNSTNKVPLIKKNNLLRVCNTMKDYGDVNKKNVESKKPPQLNINVMKFIDNDVNNIELELSNISFYNKFLKNIKEEKEKSKEKVNQENDKDDKETNINTNELEIIKNNIPVKSKINNSGFDTSKNNTNNNKNIKEINKELKDVKELKEVKENRCSSPINLKPKHKMRKHSTKILSFGGLESSCNLDYLIKSKKELHKKKYKNSKKNNPGGVHKEKSKRKQDENAYYHKHRKIQHLSQTPLNKTNRNKIISENNSIQDYCGQNNNKHKSRYKDRQNRKESNKSLNNKSERNSSSSVMKLDKNNIKKPKFVKYYSSGKIEDDVIASSKKKNESSFEDNIIRESYDHFENVKSVGKHHFRNSSSVNDKFQKFSNKRKHFNTQDILNNNNIISMQYDLDLTSKKSKLTKNNLNNNNTEQYLEINNNKLQIMKAENLISLEFNGKKNCKEKNLTENKNENDFSKNKNNINFYGLNINNNDDEKNDTDNEQKQKKGKKLKKKKCFCCL